MLKSPICERLQIEFPLLAFSHCRDVVAAVSKAGGMGVLGAVNMPPDQLETELTWLDEQCKGKPYGVDLLIPNKMVGKDDPDMTADKMAGMVPQEHKDFADNILDAHEIAHEDLDAARRKSAGFGRNMREDGAQASVEVAFRHPIRLIANALGVPPRWMLDLGKKHDVQVAALVGAKTHAVRQVEAGVDILVVSGTEGGGHCGSVSTMVLVPEIARAVAPVRSTPILAAGGIVTGEQMAAAMAMGAHGAWTGSVWLTTAEAETQPIVKEKMLAASSSDTVRSRSRTGKHSRQLRSPWTDAWEQEDAPEPLPMPLQSLVSEPALARVDKMAESGHAGARQLATYWVGQGVGLMQQSLSAGQVVQAFKEEFAAAYERLSGFLAES